MKDTTNRLLVIDDEPLIRGFISAVARQMGFMVTATGDADEFRASYLEAPPSIVILDLQMPQVDGVEILRFLESVNSEASIFVVSGMHKRTLASAENLGRSKGLNMYGGLQKPIRLETLRNALRAVMKEKQQISAEGLRQAIRKGELEVCYQPIASQDSTVGWTVDAAEALVRWRHPEYGLVMPDRFITLAEESDLIMPLTDYVLRESIEQYGLWRAAGLNVKVSINMSPCLLTNVDFPDYLDQVFAEYGVDASHFSFELTEGATARDMELTMDVLTRLRLKGVGLSIDDFGTGYSSLKQLFLLPFTELKLDRSFVSRMKENADARKMVKVMINLAHELGMTSVAEGVEDTKTMKLLEELGCEKIQGFLISKAVPGDSFQEVLETWNSPGKTFFGVQRSAVAVQSGATDF